MFESFYINKTICALKLSTVHHRGDKGNIIRSNSQNCMDFLHWSKLFSGEKGRQIGHRM